MAVTFKPFNSFYTNVGNGTINLSTNAFKMMLMGTGYTWNPDTQDARDDITAQEVTGTGYTAGGISLTGETWAQDNANNRTLFDHDDATFTNVTISTIGAVVYKDAGTAATDLLAYFLDFGGTQTVVGSDFVVQVNATGAFAMRAEPAV